MKKRKIRKITRKKPNRRLSKSRSRKTALERQKEEKQKQK